MLGQDNKGEDNNIKDELKQDKDKREKKLKLKDDIIDILKTIVIATIVAFIITNFIIVNAVVPTGSMKNTIMPKDRLIAFRLSYLFTEPKRNDIIVFKYPDDESKLYVKRVIGMPGDKINIVEGKVYINDSTEPLPDEYIPPDYFDENGVNVDESFGPYTVPDKHYFALGDNRGNSWDSRYWDNTYISEDKILGKAVFKYYPKPEILWNK